jgi:hypothetical protein
MRRKEWDETISKECQFVIPVQGGAMCGESKRGEYCDFRRCPKLELEIKVD